MRNWVGLFQLLDSCKHVNENIWTLSFLAQEIETTTIDRSERLGQ